MTKVFIVILNFDGKRDTLKCLSSIGELKVKSYELQIVVIDNGSTDGSVEEIKNLTLRLLRYYSGQVRSGQELKIIKNEKNLGFAAGNNVGIRYALGNSADWVVILNNDTIVPKNFLDLLETSGDIAGPVIKFRQDRKWIYDYGGRVNWWIGRPKHYELPHHLDARGPVGLHPRPMSLVTLLPAGTRRGTTLGLSSGRRPALATPRLNGDSCHPSPATIDYLSGCCLVIKRKVFEKIGLFDERFFLYFEDLDFCLRAAEAGFKIALEPKVIILHKLGGTVGRWSKTAIFHNLRSNFIFITKHLGWRRPLGYLYLLFLSIKIIIERVVLK